ncbi:hypothetical protein DPMN_091356 [Dreissena polymorpha]|uniref:Uncharacterized protein n=1 Tax=Dreissena polymorpha TaxID=45954 RepID=A0A9D4QZ22_DREPO|nr:hypothetical protein DPMN_091356 [Dreissena polymorpha]
MNLLTKFHEDQTINVASRVLTRLKMPRPLAAIFFKQNVTIFELIQDIIETNLLTKVLTRFYYSHIWKTVPPPGGNFHDDWAKIVTSRDRTLPPGGHVFQRTETIFELNQHII